MRIPNEPTVAPLTHLSPSLYEAARTCKARASWMAFGDRHLIPQHPSALLGSSVHAVVEDAHAGRIPPGSDDSRKAVARTLFDEHARQLYDQAHPLLRVKFPSPERTPFYHLYRERAVLLALEAATRPSASHPLGARPAGRPQSATLVEQTLRSQDNLLVGRPDYVDEAAGEVIDYKTGPGPEADPDGLHEAEKRQLRFYVHLAQEVGINVAVGAIVRADGRRARLDIPAADAAAEGLRARETLQAFNAEVGKRFAALAAPSPENCRYCPCIPLCEGFWQNAAADWADRCGWHVEGVVSNVQSATMQATVLLTMDLSATRGTVAHAATVLQQLPERWVCADGAPSLCNGDLIRIVDARCDIADGLTLIRPDRVSTTVWSGT